ncbi:hypothetical protein QVD17_22802 [Tagetes erecta]|uniref:Uncharacterized protein n=1 Tax=Tagetes erecta TaxID=13708 RepID=A0AAD8NTU1_TARER|nr:hypothetical protein QVD17_22802 [Tagetes erecta]
MGACFSSKMEDTSKVIRVVHLDGSFEHYDEPAIVNQVINNYPKHFLCSPIQILQHGLVPLMLDQQLKTGQIYFMLPNSTLKFNASPMELTSLTRKLTNIAKTGRCPAKSVPLSHSAKTVWDQRVTSSNKFLGQRCGAGVVECVGNTHNSTPWKPVLATIRET